MKYENGSEYVGEWSANKRHGKGKMKYCYCLEYDGEWFEDFWHVKGKIKLA